jgi:hypothetical protein
MVVGRPRPAAGGKSAVVAAALRRLSATPARGYAAAALTAALVGIVVNALALQHARHPAPFFAHAPAVAAAAAPNPTQVPAQVSAQGSAQAAAETTAAPAAPTPPARPVQLGATAASGGDDAIADMLRADEEREAQKRLAAAQAALIKLGYVVKTDGEPSAATSMALREFERAHGLSPSNDVTPRLLKALSTAAAVAGR